MALVKTTLPGIAPTHVCPYDALNAFALAQTLTATAYASNVNTQLTYGPGRYEGYWRLDITAAYMTGGNEFYQFWLLGSNDPTFTSGNIEVLNVHDIAATAALRVLPTILAVSPAVPDTGLNASSFVMGFSNQKDQYVFEYLQLYVVAGGTTPSVTFSSWVSPWSGQKS